MSTGGGNAGDGGISRRVLGSLLTWLADRKKPVFIVATANDISDLPPELIRKGRFDEIFFVDFPTPATRAHIFGIHLTKRGLDAGTFDIPTCAQLTHDFSGAEIEQAVVAARFEAAARGSAVNKQDLILEIQRTRPLSVIMAERIAALRAWASQRAVMAEDSSTEASFAAVKSDSRQAQS